MCNYNKVIFKKNKKKTVYPGSAQLSPLRAGCTAPGRDVASPAVRLVPLCDWPGLYTVDRESYPRPGRGCTGEAWQFVLLPGSWLSCSVCAAEGGRCQLSAMTSHSVSTGPGRTSLWSVTREQHWGGGVAPTTPVNREQVVGDQVTDNKLYSKYTDASWGLE